MPPRKRKQRAVPKAPGRPNRVEKQTAKSKVSTRRTARKELSEDNKAEKESLVSENRPDEAQPIKGPNNIDYSNTICLSLQEIKHDHSQASPRNLCTKCQLVKDYRPTIDPDLLLMGARKGCSSCLVLATAIEHFYSFWKAPRPSNRGHSVWEVHIQFTPPILSILWPKPRPRPRLALYIKYGEHIDILRRTKTPWLSSVPVFTNIESTPSGTNTFNTISSWIEDCLNNHPQCHSLSRVLPSRVIQILPDFETCRLYKTQGESSRYIALSHCWGLSTQVVITTKKNIQDRFSGFSVRSLSKTFQDAITMCRKLDICFLWIDSLCIIQDDPADWAEESSKMASVYENAFLTLAATSAVNGSEGLFRTRNVDNCEMDIPIVDENEHNIPEIVHLVAQRTREHTSLDPGPLADPLSTRGWAFQERILSQRIIHFAREELIWECCCKITCECGGQATKESRTWGNTPLDSVGQIRLSFHKTQQKSESTQASWTKVVQKYTLLELTKDDDRLPALSGIASRLITRNNFVAGLRRDNFIHDMMWSTGFDLNRPNTRNSIIQTPSWSWASVNVGVEWDPPDTYTSPVNSLSPETSSSQGSSHGGMITLDIKEIISNPSSTDPYGKVSGGSLHIKGSLIEVFRLDTNSPHLPLNLGYSLQLKQLPTYLESTPLPFGIASLFPDDRPEIDFRNGHLHINGELPTSFWLLGVQDFWQERHTVAVKMLVLINRQKEGDFRRIGTALDVFERRYPLSVREGEKPRLYETLCHRLLREADPTELQIF